ncbi:MAG: thiamine pyrophosphate-dependent dehydrogenase E1 component subunit alpha [Nitrospirae bacterium]|nr:thiamine pyrophosphate-dependent dehydrogenase E1 component subunit alpha [Nitrospirota bacterium]
MINTGDTAIAPATLRGLYEVMLRIRMFEDRTAALYSEQLMKCPVHLCIGQEAIAAGVCAHLNKEDYIFSTHRSHGHCIAKGMELKPIAAELYGRSTGCAGGRGGSMHLVAPEIGVPGTTAIVGGCIPLAAGAALSSKMKKNGRISVAFFGDGAADEGAFHESLNYASLKKLPVIFVCENNNYATNSPQKARQPDVRIADRAAGYGMPGIWADGNNVVEVYKASEKAVALAREGNGPTLLEFRTYRWKAHVGPNPDIESGCRPADEYEQWLKRCPVDMFGSYLTDNGIMSEAEIDAMAAAVEKEIDEAIEFGKSGPEPPASELYDYVY